MRLPPALSYYGSKWRAAGHYPAPRHHTIIEPFAGGAGYSLRYSNRNVVLIEKNEVVAAVWRYLIDVDPGQVRSLPDIRLDQTTDDLDVEDVERWLIGFWLGAGIDHPNRRMSSWGRDFPTQFWGEAVRERLAVIAANVSHWTVIHGDYSDAPDIPATWFVDPPYQVAGTHYPHGSKAIDFEHLGEWCQSRPGQVIACENEGADWLPFRTFREIRSNQANSGRTNSSEVIWTSGCVEQMVMLHGGG